MARARNLKPSFFLNTDLAQIEPFGRILFQGLWCLADRAGRLEDNPLKIKAQVLPYDNPDIDKLLTKLHTLKLIIRYHKNGEKFIQITNFTKHQYPHVREQESTIPAPDKHHTSTVQIRLNPESPIPHVESPIIASQAANGSAPSPPKRQESNNPTHRLVRAWRRITNVLPEDYKSWDKVNFGRCAKQASMLLEIFAAGAAPDEEKLVQIADCMVETYEELTKKGLDCTLETVSKRAHEWKYKHEGAFAK